VVNMRKKREAGDVPIVSLMKEAKREDKEI
jgi:hypothetical protein